VNETQRIVVWNFARDVVANVRLRDAVGRVRTNPSHDGPEVAKEIAIESRKRTADKGELGWAIVR
jgi:hypothetical protein